MSCSIIIRTETNEYVIKEVNPKTDWTDVVARVNTDDLYGTQFESFDFNDTVANVAGLALAGTGWTIGHCDITKVRHISKKYANALDIIGEINNIWLCDISFDAINKKVNFYNEMGSDKGGYFIDRLNLKELELQGTSYDFITRLIPLGYKNLDITSVNNGCNYIENHQYSSKVITGYWRTKQYTDPVALKEDAEVRLEKYSQPVKAYTAKVIDLASCSPDKYSILEYSLGDTITLIDSVKGIKDKVRIVKTTEYPYSPETNEVQIANRLQILQDMQIQFMDAADSVDAVTNGDGSTIDGTAIDGVSQSQITDLSIGTAEIQDASITTAKIGNLAVTTAQIADASITNAKIGDLAVDTANIKDGSITNAKIATASIDSAQIQDAAITNAKIGTAAVDTANIKNGAITTALIAVGCITTALIETGAVQTAQIADGSITDAKIVTLTANKITAGTIDASEIDVVNLHAANITVGTINGNQIANGSIDVNKLADNAVSTAKIAQGCITSDKIAPGAITGDNLAAGSIKAAQLNWATHLMY